MLNQLRLTCTWLPQFIEDVATVERSIMLLSLIRFASLAEELAHLLKLLMLLLIDLLQEDY